MQAGLLSEACKEHKSLTSTYVLMLSMGIENAQNIFLLWYFQHFEENLGIILFFFLILFSKCGGTLVVLVIEGKKGNEH